MKSALNVPIIDVTQHDATALCDVVARCFELPREHVVLETRLVEDLGTDSIDLLALVTELETEFRVIISDEAITRICKIGDLLPHIKPIREM